MSIMQNKTGTVVSTTNHLLITYKCTVEIPFARFNESRTKWTNHNHYFQGIFDLFTQNFSIVYTFLVEQMVFKLS